MRPKFIDWLTEYYGPDGEISQLYPVMGVLSLAEIDQIKNVAQHWQHTWQMAEFDTNTVLGRPVGIFRGLIGKEFMGSQSARVRWKGHLLVNQPSSPGMQQYMRYKAMRCERDLSPKP